MPYIKHWHWRRFKHKHQKAQYAQVVTCAATMFQLVIILFQTSLLARPVDSQDVWTGRLPAREVAQPTSSSGTPFLAVSSTITVGGQWSTRLCARCRRPHLHCARCCLTPRFAGHHLSNCDSGPASPPQKDPLLQGPWGFINSKNYWFRAQTNAEKKNAMYNDWGKHKCPGLEEWRDEADPSKTLDGYGVVADSAFPVSKGMFLPIFTPLEDGDLLRASPACRPALVALNNAITSLCQAPEWGMGSAAQVFRTRIRHILGTLGIRGYVTTYLRVAFAPLRKCICKSEFICGAFFLKDLKQNSQNILPVTNHEFRSLLIGGDALLFTHGGEKGGGTRTSLKNQADETHQQGPMLLEG
ncbi:hypothetical protein BDK51DRAFT_28305 [Blyttiomyces helicus]|uniref:DDE Tnp4 domain-containing protein n=1 Tax=Blyttiomyces helicus TaxID=388810 RepID=A0A4V1IRR9_9FUNG|nr:hypothetical protein BDK51DRAFT_28305 [Blyttiomyces helicus]|eukprot:RKO91017.1 hypothetical protein BDK51DRAFT_28305 [Blyttiomyces helicus]